MNCTAAALRTQTGAVIPLLDSAAIEMDQKRNRSRQHFILCNLYTTLRNFVTFVISVTFTASATSAISIQPLENLLLLLFL